MRFNSFLTGCVITLVIVAGIAWFYHGRQKYVMASSEKTTETVYDTIQVFIDTPILRDSMVIRYATVTLPVYDTIKIHHADTLFSDSVSVTLPITQKVYKDSAYEAWVSGYMPALDSIRIFQPITTITNTITNTEIRYKQKRWGLGVQVGIGVTPSKIEPYVGIGVSYNIFSW